MKQKAIQLLKDLSEAHGASGCEYSVRNIFERELKNNLSLDHSGCIICTEKGPKKTPKILVEAHMDEVGFMVQSITDSGLIKFVTLGGWWGHTLLAKRVRVLTQEGSEIIGLITCKPPHFLGKEEREKIVKSENMYIDVGAMSADQCINDFGISLGDTIVPDSQFTRMKNPDVLLGKAFDNRVGVSLAIQATQMIRKISHPNTICTVGSVQEEVGVRGIQTVMNTVHPDIAIVLEGTPADDFPGTGTDTRQGQLGQGPQIRFADPTALLSREFSKYVISTAKEMKLKHQVAVRRSGGTNAREIQFHGLGIPTVVIGVPARYIHTQNSMIQLGDYIATLKLIVELLKRLDHAITENFKPKLRANES